MEALTTVHFIMLATFLVGYAFIIFEHRLHINKGAAALLLAGALWSLYFTGAAPSLHEATHNLELHLSEVSQIVFFLIGAMTLVEVIDSHGSFRLVTDQIRTRSKLRIMWLLAVMAFFMSALLDNLTTTIVMVSLLRRILPNRENRMLLGSMVVVAANAGGAWTPMGDVTTTMLWIGGQVTTLGVMTALLVPSIVTMVVAVLLLGIGQRGHYGGEAEAKDDDDQDKGDVDDDDVEEGGDNPPPDPPPKKTNKRGGVAARGAAAAPIAAPVKPSKRAKK